MSAVLGGALTSALAKAFIAKSLAELDAVVAKIGEINVQLASIAVRLEAIDKDHDLLLRHDRKLAVVENEVFRRVTGTEGKTKDRG